MLHQRAIVIEGSSGAEWSTRLQVHNDDRQRVWWGLEKGFVEVIGSSGVGLLFMIVPIFILLESSDCYTVIIPDHGSKFQDAR